MARGAIYVFGEQVPATCEHRADAVRSGIVNNAGIIQPFVRLNDLDDPTIERVINVNLLGILFVTKAFLPHLLRRPEAHIANISSNASLIPDSTAFQMEARVHERSVNFPLSSGGLLKRFALDGVDSSSPVLNLSHSQ